MIEEIKNLLEAVAYNVQIRQPSFDFHRCEFWFEADYIPFGIFAQIRALSNELSIGVIGFNNGFYYITVYGISSKS